MDTQEMKKCKKSIDILQVAATDKENLSRKIAPKSKLIMNNGRIRLGKKDGKAIESGGKSVVLMKNNINKIKTEHTQKKKTDIVIASDLTKDSPSEKYWEKLAESRRIALESALKENAVLNTKLSEVEYENSRLKEMLNEAQTLVEVLTEMLEGNKDDDEEEIEKDRNLPGKSDEASFSDSDVENDSFKSCL